jgi:hypothetical protein
MNNAILVITVFVLLLQINIASAQSTWVRMYGGSNQDIAASMTMGKDGSLIATGSTYSNDGDFNILNKGQNDIIFLKFNNAGNIIVKKTFGGNNADFGTSITNGVAGDCIIAGNTFSNDGDFLGMQKGGMDGFAMKLYNSGTILWKTVIGGTSSEYVNSVFSIESGGYLIAGNTSSNDGDFAGLQKGQDDIFIIKLSEDGIIEWRKTYGGISNETCTSIAKTTDGGFVLTGYTSSNSGDFAGMSKGNEDIFVMKIDANGSMLWAKTYGGSGIDRGASITITLDGNYLLTGLFFSNDGDFSAMNKGDADMFIAKIDAKGTLLWNKGIGGSALDYGNHVTVTQNNEYIISGSTKSNEVFGELKGKEDFIIVKINNDGEVLWSKGYGGSETDRTVKVLAGDQPQVMVYGYSSSNDGDFNGKNKGLFDLFLMKLDSNGNISNTSSVNQFIESNSPITVHPNPSSDMSMIAFTVETPSRIKLELLNSLGQTLEIISDDIFESGTYQFSLNTSHISSGIYSVRMQSASDTFSIPLVNMK